MIVRTDALTDHLRHLDLGVRRKGPVIHDGPFRKNRITSLRTDAEEQSGKRFTTPIRDGRSKFYEAETGIGTANQFIDRKPALELDRNRTVSSPPTEGGRSGR
jgi:hypothetical protein